jgi:hypothetical protein
MIKQGVAAMAAMSIAVSGAPAAVQPVSAPSTADDVGVGADSTAQPLPTTPAEPQLVVAAPAAPVELPGAILLPKDSLIRLMVLNEVNTHKAKPGDRFVLRVDEAVAIGGVTVIPVGAKAWGEVTEVRENGAVGKAGRIGARLLYAEVGPHRIPLSGEEQSKGNKGGDRVAFAVVGFGVLGLLARGSQGKLKAGHIFNGYLAQDVLYDPATSSIIDPNSAPSASAQP